MGKPQQDTRRSPPAFTDANEPPGRRRSTVVDTPRQPSHPPSRIIPRSLKRQRSGEQLTGTIKASGLSGTDHRKRKRRGAESEESPGRSQLTVVGTPRQPNHPPPQHLLRDGWQWCSGGRVTRTKEASGPSGTDDRERKRRRAESKASPGRRRPTVVDTPRQPSHPPAQYTHRRSIGDGATVVEEVHRHISGLSHPRSPMVTEQPPADGAAGDTAHIFGNCIMGVINALPGVVIGAIVDDLHDWAPSVIGAVCDSAQTAAELSLALEARDPPWELTTYEHICVARRPSVFDAWLDHHFHHDTDNGIALIVTMTCHMAVAGQNAITVAVIDVGCGDDHT